MRQNPFVIEQAVLSQTLIVRQEELRQVKAALAQGRKLFLRVWLQKLPRSLATLTSSYACHTGMARAAQSECAKIWG